MATNIRGEKVSYERIVGFGKICAGCLMNFNGTCLIWKYVSSPEVCREFSEEIDRIVSKCNTSPTVRKISYQKVLSEWDWKTKRKAYAYYAVKSKLDVIGYRITGVREISEKEYNEKTTRKMKDVGLVNYEI